MSELSFTWKGQSSDDFGIAVMRLPDVVQAAQRGTAYTVAGRDGTLYVDDEALDEIVLMVECYLPYEQGDKVASLDEIRAWLRGSGEFTQSDVPGRKFRARITDQISFQPLMVGFADRLFGITLYAEPYQYADPEELIVLTEPVTDVGGLHNPGTDALPWIQIEGSGDITMTISRVRLEGEWTMTFEGLTDGIIVDCEAMECLDLSQTELLNSKATMDEYPRLPAGDMRITWTGDVTKVTIKPRWRYL